MQKKLLFLPLIIFFLLLSCAPVPPIQSSRITSHFSFFNSAVLNTRDIKWELIDSTGRSVDELPPYGYIPNPIPEPRWSIKKRIEISGIYYPPITVFVLGPAWSLNCKTFLYEFGQPKLFRNLCSSIFVGSIYKLSPSNTLFCFL